MKSIILKYLYGEISIHEMEQLKLWLEDPKNHKKFKEQVQLYYMVNRTLEPSNTDEAYRKLLRNIEQGKMKSNFIPKKSLLKWQKYVVAASILILVSIGFVMISKNEPTIQPVAEYNNNIKIGTDKATLTLEDGSRVALEKGKTYKTGNLNSNGEALIYNSEKDQSETEIAYNYLTIPRGGQFFVKLSDGTQVWLNSESQLKYPVTFVEGKPRQVELIYGEAYFDVSPSTEHHGSKFKVISGIQNIEVVGTEFNVKAYKDEKNIYTSLVEGRVNVKGSNDTGLYLSPNEQSILNVDTGNLSIQKVDAHYETSWKRGLFSFKNKSLKDIMKVLSRWYDVDVYFEDKSLENIQFKGVLKKNQDIDEILMLIKNTKTINDYEIKNNILLIKR